MIYPQYQECIRNYREVANLMGVNKPLYLREFAKIINEQLSSQIVVDAINVMASAPKIYPAIWALWENPATYNKIPDNIIRTTSYLKESQDVLRPQKNIGLNCLTAVGVLGSLVQDNYIKDCQKLILAHTSSREFITDHVFGITGRETAVFNRVPIFELSRFRDNTGYGYLTKAYIGTVSIPDNTTVLYDYPIVSGGETVAMGFLLGHFQETLGLTISN